MLTQLPLDLFRSITEDYLRIDVRHLSHLDIAFCNHRQRSDLLALVREVRAVNETLCTKGAAFRQYLQWLRSRHVRVLAMWISVSVFADELPVLTQPLFGVLDIHLHPQAKRQKKFAHMERVLAFLKHLPDLKMLSLWMTIRNEQLEVLEQLTSSIPLEHLDLLECTKITSVAATKLICCIGKHLKVLRCHVLKSAGLLQIADCCRSLTTLVLHCSHHVSSLSLERLCAANALSLTQLSLHGALSPETLMRIVQLTPHLVAFHNNNPMMREAAQFVRCLLTHCRGIAMIGLSHIAIEVVPAVGPAEGQVVAEFTYHFFTAIQDVADLLMAIPWPLQKCKLFFLHDVVATPVLRCLAERCESMESFELYVREPICDASSLSDVLHHSINLTAFTANLILSPSVLHCLCTLPAVCSKLRQLAIGHCHDEPYGAEVSVPIVLTAFSTSPNVVEDFSLDWSAKIDCATLLLTIAEAFPHLHQLSVFEGDLPISTMVELICSGRLRATRINAYSHESFGLSQQLEKRGVRHNQGDGATFCSVVALVMKV